MPHGAKRFSISGRQQRGSCLLRPARPKAQLSFQPVSDNQQQSRPYTGQKRIKKRSADAQQDDRMDSHDQPLDLDFLDTQQAAERESATSSKQTLPIV